MSDNNVKNLRKFHNYVKKKLIDDTYDYIVSTYDIYDIKLLDLAVGRGGDISKWYEKGIMTVYGFDIDMESIKGKDGAIQRYSWLLGAIKRKGGDMPNYKFYVQDLSKDMAIDFVKRNVGGIKFQIISCQFAIHYFFKSKETLDTFIKIISENIADNGFFIGTCMNSKKLVELFDETPIINRELYQLSRIYDRIDTPYNNTYVASLGTSRDKGIYFKDKPSIEYLVDMDELTKICEKYGLVYVGVTNFDQWYKKYLSDDGRYKMSNSEMEFSMLNMSFVFKKG